MSTGGMLLLIALGVFIGWYIGRMCAEDGRARFDMNNTWKNRQNYRK